MQQSMITGSLWVFHQWNFTNMGKQHMGNFLMGMGEVQMLQMNQLHNDDVMNMNGQSTDGLNEQVTEDDVRNVNG